VVALLFTLVDYSLDTFYWKGETVAAANSSQECA